jgi:hypothetical protein
MLPVPACLVLSPEPNLSHSTAYVALSWLQHLLNSTRACQNTVATSCQLSPDACVNELVDAALRSEAAAAAAATQRRNTAVAVVVPIVIGEQWLKRGVLQALKLCIISYALAVSSKRWSLCFASTGLPVKFPCPLD